MHVLLGVALGLVITLVVAKFAGFGAPRISGYGSGLALAFRAIAEVILIAVAGCALIATAVIGTAVAWNIFAGYIAVRAVALVLEVVSSK